MADPPVWAESFVDGSQGPIQGREGFQPSAQWVVHASTSVVWGCIREGLRPGHGSRRNAGASAHSHWYSGGTPVVSGCLRRINGEPRCG